MQKITVTVTQPLFDRCAEVYKDAKDEKDIIFLESYLYVFSMIMENVRHNKKRYKKNEWVWNDEYSNTAINSNIFKHGYKNFTVLKEIIRALEDYGVIKVDRKPKHGMLSYGYRILPEYQGRDTQVVLQHPKLMQTIIQVFDKPMPVFIKLSVKPTHRNVGGM